MHMNPLATDLPRDITHVPVMRQIDYLALLSYPHTLKGPFECALRVIQVT